MKDEKDKHNGCEENEKESVIEQAGIYPDDFETGPEKPGLNFLDLIYGVLFDPARTFQKVAANPPLWQAVLIYVLVSVLTGAMGVFVNFRIMPAAVSELSSTVMGLVQSILPLLALGGILLQFVKWFTYSALLHLLADFFGGKGTARGVFTVYGLAGLPTLFIIPVQLLVLGISPGNSWLDIFTIPVSIALTIWAVILLILGIKEVHGFSTGRAAAVVFTPVAAMAVLVVITIITMVSVITSIPSLDQWRFM
ncbi:MAG: YIP1 family protein [Firmicutes bacterium]|nr:YIP1 family protein [Bacillota bacterium]